MVKKNILGTIGGTPMVRINRLCPNPNVNIYAKLEGFNPTGSIKDRIALRMIEEAEQDGRLTPGKTIIEPTSGNTGIGLAIVGIVKGYPVEIVMSSAVSVETGRSAWPAARWPATPTNISCPTSLPMRAITWRITSLRHWKSGSRQVAGSTTWSVRSARRGR